MDELLAQARQGDEAAERKLFQNLFERFSLFAKTKIQREAEAEDIAQEACLTVLEKYKTQTFPSGFIPWAHGVLKMKIGNYLQKTAIRRKTLVSSATASGKEGASSLATDPEFRRQLTECIRKIARANRRYARVLNLMYQGYETDEICDRLKLNRNTVYIILSRGRSMLRTCLETGEV